jgi:hypothetical protein
MRRLAVQVVVVFAILFAAVAQASAVEREYVILSGGPSLIQWEKYKATPHDLWWMNFIRASRLRIQEIRAQQGPDAKITWLVYVEGYKRRQAQESQNLLSIIYSVRDAYNVNLILFDQTSDVINYLNNGQPRISVKIADFEYFGHSNKACWMFDYSNEIDSASKVWLHQDDFQKIRRGIFTRDAHVKSWGCHTGEMMSKEWRKATGIPMIGAVGKTQYMTHTLPILSSAGGRWTQ